MDRQWASSHYSTPPSRLVFTQSHASRFGVHSCQVCRGQHVLKPRKNIHIINIRHIIEGGANSYCYYYYYYYYLIYSSSCVCPSYLESSRGEPGSRVLAQADNSFSARRRPVLWADIQDVVHCLLWGTTFTDRGVIEAPLQHGRAEPAYTRAKAVEGCPLPSRQVEARDAVWIADEVVQSRRRSCQPIVFPAGPEPGLLRHAWGRQIAEMMGLLGEGAT